MRFWKMNGAGNDFIILNNLDGALSHDALPGIVRIICERHLSLGADGVMVVEPSVKADFKMLFFNSDGSMGEMCGNGARCICRYGYETGLAGSTQTIETTAGIVTGERIDPCLYRIRLNDPSVLERRDVAVDGITYRCTYVELGDPGIPHAVVPIPHLRDADPQWLFDLGRKLRYHPAFPKGANVNFYELTGPDAVFERTWERGVEDFTYACGTGTGSVAAVLTLEGAVSGRQVSFTTRGGTLIMDVCHTGGHIDALYLTGPTNVVAKGELTDEALPR
jgi:diaminopimelate epimerase